MPIAGWTAMRAIRFTSSMPIEAAVTWGMDRAAAPAALAAMKLRRESSESIARVCHESEPSLMNGSFVSDQQVLGQPWRRALGSYGDNLFLVCRIIPNGRQDTCQ